MAEWEIAGKRWELPERQTIVATNAVSVLGEAETSLQHLPFVSAAYPFRVRVLLTHPDILYARQRQRTWLFGALIVASTLAALIGLGAWSARSGWAHDWHHLRDLAGPGKPICFGRSPHPDIPLAAYNAD